MSNELTDEQVDRRERCMALVEQLMTLPCRCDPVDKSFGISCIGCKARRAIGGPR